MVRLGRGDYIGQPIKLTSYQRRWVHRLYEFYPETGRRRYTRAIIGTGKGNGKTPFEAAIGAAELCGPFAPADPLVLVAASSLGQADLVFGDFKLGVTHDESPLKTWVVPYELSLQLRGQPGEAKRVAAVAGSNDGPRATSLLADELHEWVGALRDVFDVLDGAIGKRLDAFTLAISTAGSDLTSLLGEMYVRGKALSSGEVVDDATLFEWYEIPEWLDVPELIESPADERAWLEAIRWANPALAEPGASFLSADYVRSRFDGAQTLPRYKWWRYHGNRWSRSEEAWLPPGAWDACRRVYDPLPGVDVVLGFAGTYNGDSAGLVGVALTGSHVFALDAWEGQPGAAAAYQVPRGEVDAAVAAAVQRFKVRRLVVNPNGWHGEAQRWADRYGADVVVEFDWQHQQRRKVDACSSFYTATTTGALTHDGNPRLARHLESVQVVEQREGAYIGKGGRGGAPVELAVAAVLAFDQVGSLPPPPRKASPLVSM